MTTVELRTHSYETEGIVGRTAFGMAPVLKLSPCDGSKPSLTLFGKGVNSMGAKTSLIPSERIESRILLIRGEKVLIDSDLASLYGVSTGALNHAIGRNRDRFPDDFMFILTQEEMRNLKSQTVISSSHGGRRSAITAFTEQGVAMLSSVLRSPAGGAGEH